KFFNILSRANDQLGLSDLRGKLVIIDFWERHCSSCIASFPKMQKLQQTFGDSIHIILVTQNTKDELEPLFKQFPIVAETKLPMIVADTVLHDLFPHTFVPFLVWIDQTGVIRDLSGSSKATAETIQHYLGGP